MAVTNVRKFNADLQAFAASINVQFETVVRKLIIDLFRRVVEKTPVDTGRARASWTLNIGRPSYQAQRANYKSNGPAATQEAMGQLDKVKNVKPFEEIVWIANGLHYLPYLENGTATIAPVAMVELSIVEAEAEIEAEMKRRAR